MSGYCELCSETVCVCTNEPIVTNAMVQRDLQDEIERLNEELEEAWKKEGELERLEKRQFKSSCTYTIH